MSSQPGSILEVLPVDVLDLILQELKCSSFPSLSSLRLVCKEFSNLVEPLMFGAVKLLPYKPLSSEFQTQLKRLASGKSPNSRWTKELRIEPASLIPVVKLHDGQGWTPQYCPDEELRRQSALVIQKKYLVRAIESLKHVTSARYHPCDKEPYEDVLGALSRLPNLDHISLSFSSTFEGQPLPLAAFSNLRKIELTRTRFFPSVISSIQGMLIASSKTLESLILTPNGWGQEFGGSEPPTESRMVQVLGLDSLLAGSSTDEPTPTSKKETAFARLSSRFRSLAQKASSQEIPTAYPRLKKLTINTNRIGLSAAVVPLLPSLEHLDAANVGAGHIEESFWQASGQHKIRLDSLVMWSISSPVTAYLSTYSGLKTLFLRDVGEATSLAEDNKLFTVVLPRHRRTLENLWLDTSLGRDYSTATEARVECILRCHELLNLWISYPFPEAKMGGGSADHRSEELGAFFSRLAVSLPKLRNLFIRASRQILPRAACGTWRRKRLARVADEFIETILQADIPEATPSFTVSVRGAVGGCEMGFDRERRKFVKI